MKRGTKSYSISDLLPLSDRHAYVNNRVASLLRRYSGFDCAPPDSVVITWKSFFLLGDCLASRKDNANETSDNVTKAPRVCF